MESKVDFMIVLYMFGRKRFINKLYLKPMEKIFVMAWFIWIYKNNVIFSKHSSQPGHIIKLAVNLFEDMTYYNIVSNVWLE